MLVEELHVTNKDDIQWLAAMSDEEKRNDAIRQCITLGRICMQNSQIHMHLDSGTGALREEMAQHMSQTLACVGESVERIVETRNILSKTMVETLKAQNAFAERLIDPIASRVDKLNESVESIFNIRGTSNTKGKFGESLIAQHITTVFPDYDVKNMSNTAHEADFQIGTEYGMVLLEVKTYTTNVSKEQMEKFYRDIERTAAPFAIFLSTTSGIVGKKHIEWQVWGKHRTIVLFFPNSSLSQQGIVFSLLFMKALVEAEIHKESGVTFRKSEQEVSVLMDTFEHFYQSLVAVMEKNSKLRADLSSCKITMDKLLDELYKQTFDLELQHKAALETMYGRLKDKLHLRSSNSSAYKWLGDAAEFSAWVAALNLKPAQIMALNHLYARILDVAAADMQVCHDKSQPVFHIVQHSRVLATCHIAKTKIDVIFEMPKESFSADTMTLHPQFETFKNNEITITLQPTLTSACCDIICKRLCAGAAGSSAEPCAKTPRIL
jgi:hypothetical protein